MKPLILLLLVFVVSLTINRWATGTWNFLFAGNLAMFLMLCFTAIGHFKFIEGMTMMIPGFIPFKKEIVYLTGIMEVILGLGLMFPRLRTTSAIILVLMFVLMLPANINAAIRHIDYEKANFEGSGIGYLWFRIPLQVFFIAWLWFFSIRNWPEQWSGAS